MDTAEDPVCPNCRAAWTYEFIASNLTQTFRTTTYKKHRGKVLVDRERARFPETQEHAAAYKNARAILNETQPKKDELQKKIFELPEFVAYDRFMEQMKDHHKYSYYYHMTPEEKTQFEQLKENYEKAARPYKLQIRELNRTIRPCERTIERYGLPQEDQPRAERQVVKHTYKCPADTCEGFLSESWTCGLCNVSVCADCREIKSGDDHVCDEATKETIAALRKEAKPCPKCTALISKIDGCDQMWCTQCKTAFSWRTGAIETSYVHNPHYFQWMRETGQQIQRNPHDGGGCDVDQRLFDILHSRRWTKSVQDKLLFSIWLENARHCRYEALHYARVVQEIQDDEWKRQLRVLRMVNELTDDAWQTRLQRKEKELHKCRARQQLNQMFTQTVYDILAQLLESQDKCDEVRQQLEKLAAYVEEEASKIRRTYNCVPDRLDTIKQRVRVAA